MVSQICHIPDGSGLLFALTKGKTTDLTDPRVVFLFYSYKAEICPAKLLLDFLQFCKENDLINNISYVFRDLSGCVAFGGNPLSSSAANTRLRFYLNLCDGETPHGTRSACAIILSQLGVDRYRSN